MAYINGLNVRNMTMFRGHEGEPLYQGDLYLNDTKLGFWSQDAHGAICDNLFMERDYNEYSLRDAIKALNADKARMVGPAENRFLMEYDFESLMGDYISLYEDEKLFNNAIKKGYQAVCIVTDGYHVNCWSLGVAAALKNDDELLKVLGADIEKAKADFFPEDDFWKHEIKFYRSTQDFNIGKPINLEDVVYKTKLQDTIESCEETSNKNVAPATKDNVNRELTSLIK